MSRRYEYAQECLEKMAALSYTSPVTHKLLHDVADSDHVPNIFNMNTKHLRELSSEYTRSHLQLEEMRKNEDPRLSFSTPEFKEAQRIFTDGFKVLLCHATWVLHFKHPPPYPTFLSLLSTCPNILHNSYRMHTLKSISSSHLSMSLAVEVLSPICACRKTLESRWSGAWSRTMHGRRLNSENWMCL